MAWDKAAVWLCLPVGALVLGFLSSACAGPRENPTPSEPIQEVRLYARENEFDPQQVKVKALRRVKLQVTSLDLDYVIEAPGLGIEPQRVPAMGTLRLSFMPVNFGTYKLHGYGSASSTEMRAQFVVSVCPPEAEIPNPIPPGAESLKLGEQVYLEACQSCHGTQGRGDGPEARRSGLTPIDLTQPFMANISDGELFWIVSNGWYGMPGFKERLSEEKRWHVVNYIRSLSGR
jgi:hypothetical protein